MAPYQIMQAPNQEAQEATLDPKKDIAKKQHFTAYLACDEALLPPGQGDHVVGMLSAAAGSVQNNTELCCHTRITFL